MRDVVCESYQYANFHSKTKNIISSLIFVTYFRILRVNIREGNGTPLQYSCLEYPRDGGAWWAAIYGVAQSQTRLKLLSSSSSSSSSRVNILLENWLSVKISKRYP